MQVHNIWIQTYAMVPQEITHHWVKAISYFEINRYFLSCLISFLLAQKLGGTVAQWKFLLHMKKVVVSIPSNSS